MKIATLCVLIEKHPTRCLLLNQLFTWHNFKFDKFVAFKFDKLVAFNLKRREPPSLYLNSEFTKFNRFSQFVRQLS